MRRKGREGRVRGEENDRTGRRIKFWNFKNEKRKTDGK